MAQLTLRASLSADPSTDPPSGGTRAMRRSDIPALGDLYFRSYEPGVACDTLEEAIADIAASFDGEYGELWVEASRVVERDGKIVAAVMTVRQAPWDDVPPGPFIIELFTDPDHRRRGLARLLIARALAVAGPAALRVDSGNGPALALYRSLGFAEV